jgi:pimeloyl-ACP methyl ester carboxylesterase
LPVLFQIFKYDINVFGVDFRGYGKSNGSPSERGIYKDGISAMNFLMGSLHYKSEDIIIIGRSIGSTAACNTAVYKPVSRLILITPFSSGIEYAKIHGLGLIAYLGGNAFNNYKKCSKIKCPIFILVGTNDEITTFPLAKKLFDSISNPNKKFCAISGADHNDIMYTGHDTLWKAIGAFLKN